MLKYAQLNAENVVVAISFLSGEVVDDNMILINDVEVELLSTYNRETREFTPPEPQLQPEPTEPIDVKLDRIETQIQTDNVTQFDVLATVYEEMTVNNITQFDVMATMYEEIMALREEVTKLKGGTN